MQRLLSSPVLTALFDLPWTPIFLIGIALFHPWLGILAVIGGGILIGVAILNQVTTSQPVQQANVSTIRAERMAEQIRVEAEMVRSLGMQDATFARWQELRGEALRQTIAASDRGGSLTATSKTFRLFLQSAMLALGALLVLDGKVTPGAMIAASILLGRALAPVELALGQWQLVQRAGEGWRNLSERLSQVAEDPVRTALPRPRARLTVTQATVIPPGEQQATLRMVSFEVLPGDAVGVIGASGAGKSTLARAIVGAWRPAGGKIRLDGAALEQYEPDVLGMHIGYLPQRVQVFDGTIAENIARLRKDARDEDIVRAAQKADAHEMILRLPDGYDTRIGPSIGRLSGGQFQRVGLARAMFGDPVLLVLDEPNSNLDTEGEHALTQAILAVKRRGGVVVVIAHRPSALAAVDFLMLMDGGQQQGFGTRQEILRGAMQSVPPRTIQPAPAEEKVTG